jgi:hypothetical protein
MIQVVIAPNSHPAPAAHRAEDWATLPRSVPGKAAADILLDTDRVEHPAIHGRERYQIDGRLGIAVDADL